MNEPTRTIFIDDGEYTTEEVLRTQSVIHEYYKKIFIFKRYDKIQVPSKNKPKFKTICNGLIAICPVRYSVQEVKDIVGEAYISNSV